MQTMKRGRTGATMAAMLGKPNRQVRVLRGKPMTRQDLIKVAEKAEAGFYVVVAAANELASMAVFDAMDTLRKNDFHKCREARRWALQCERKIHDYETLMRIQLQDLSRREGSRTADGKDKYTLWLDMTDHVDEEMKPHVQRLYYAVKLLMDKNTTPHSETLARMWTAHLMLQFAVRQFDTLFDSIRQDLCGYSIRPDFASGCLQGQLQCWQKATEAMDLQLCPKELPNIDLVKDENVRNGIKAIYNCLDDENLYNRAGEYGINLNPGVTKEERIKNKI